MPRSLNNIVSQFSLCYDHNNILIEPNFQAWRSYAHGSVFDLVDKVVAKSSHHPQFDVFRAVQIGLLCVQQYPEDRPTMATVVLMLTSENALPEPTQPGFFTERKMQQEDSSTSSSNYISVTDMAPR